MVVRACSAPPSGWVLVYAEWCDHDPVQNPTRATFFMVPPAKDTKMSLPFSPKKRGWVWKSNAQA